nr:ORF48 [Human gammaherpesvirus 8]UQT64631.1 ORF48 [Human gammaherpesvirus 8]
MEVCIPIPGIGDENCESWRAQIVAFGTTSGFVKTERILRGLFPERGHPGFLASLVVLKHTLASPGGLNTRLNLLPVLQMLKYVGQEMYMRAKCQATASDMTLIWDDCKDRFMLILEQACGCHQCMTVVEEITHCSAISAPPSSLSHGRHILSAGLINFARRQVLLGGSVSFSEFSIPDLIQTPEQYPFVDVEFRRELSLISSCLNVCWLYHIFIEHITSDVRRLESCMANVLEEYGGLSPTRPWAEAVTFLSQLPRPTRKPWKELSVSRINVEARLLDTLLMQLEKPVPVEIRKHALAILGTAGHVWNPEHQLACPDTRTCRERVSKGPCDGDVDVTLVHTARMDISNPSSVSLDGDVHYSGPQRTPAYGVVLECADDSDDSLDDFLENLSQTFDSSDDEYD